MKAIRTRLPALKGNFVLKAKLADSEDVDIEGEEDMVELSDAVGLFIEDETADEASKQIVPVGSQPLAPINQPQV